MGMFIKPYTISDTYDYTRALMAIISKSDNPLMKIEDYLQTTIATTLASVKNNGIVTASINLDKLGRLNSMAYNDLISYINLDMRVLYDRVLSMIETVDQSKRSIGTLVTGLLDRTNALLTRIRSYSVLNQLGTEYDNIIMNTFSKDNATNEDRTFAAKVHARSGLLSIKPIWEDNIIQNKLNYDLYMSCYNQDATMRVLSDNPAERSTFGIGSGLMVSAISPKTTAISRMSVGIDGDENFIFDYNGLAISAIMDLADSKLVNSVSFYTFGSGPLDVIGLFYSDRRCTDPKSIKWKKININVDAANVSGQTLTFDGLEASSIMVILGQRYALKQMRDVKQYAMDTSGTDLVTMRKNLQKVDINTTGKGIRSFVPASLRNTMTKAVQNIVAGIVAIVNRLLPEPITTQTKEVYEYLFNITDMTVQYTHNQGASTYKSPYYGDKGDIDAITLSANDYMPSGTLVTYGIETAAGTARVIPLERATELITDLHIVDDITQRLFMTDFPFDPDVLPTVKINGRSVSVTAIKPYLTADVAMGILIDSSVTIGFNDQLTIEYYPSELNLMGKENSVSTVDMENILGNPTFVHQNLKCSKNRLITMPSGEFISYDVPGEADYVLMPVTEFSEEAAIGYRISDKGYLPSGAMELVQGGYGITSNFVQPPQSYIYRGTYDERHYNEASGSYLNTDYPYKPGTLNVFMFNPDTDERRQIEVTEYPTDMSGSFYDKTLFTTPNGVPNGYFYCSYVPLSGDMVSNIAKHNASELFTGTDPDGVISLAHTPFADTHIIFDSQLPVPTWLAGNGQFVLSEAPEIVYEPIIVDIRGIKAKNRTDYSKGTIPELNTYIPTRKNFEFYTLGNRMFFNTYVTLPITVNYYARPDHFRLISTLRRTNLKDDTLTPIVYDYSLLIDERE